MNFHFFFFGDLSLRNKCGLSGKLPALLSGISPRHGGDSLESLSECLFEVCDF